MSIVTLYCRCSPDGAILETNRSFASKFTVESHELIGTTLCAYVQEPDRPAARCALRSLGPDEPTVLISLWSPAAPETQIYGVATGRFEDGELTEILFHSIQEPMAIKNLKEAQRRREEFEAVAPVLFFETDTDGTLTHLGLRPGQIRQLDHDGLAMDTWTELLGEEALADIKSTITDTEATLDFRQLRVRAMSDSGVGRWFDARVQIQRTNTGEAIRCIGSLLDITEEVDAHIQSRQLLKIIDITPDFFLLAELEGSVVRYSNDPCRYQLGLLPTDEGGTVVFSDRLSEQSQRRWKDEVLVSVAESRIWTGELTMEPIPGLEIAVIATVVGHTDEQSGIELISILAQDMSAQKEAEHLLEHAANHDGLTGLVNRSFYFRALDAALVRARHHDTRVGVMYCDLDGFKAINDTLGHDAGDTVLRVVSERLTEHFRATDVVARFGGDEFVVLCDELKDDKAIENLANRLLHTINEPIKVGETSVTVGISMGVAFSTPDDNLDSIVIRADEALYMAKENGKNQAHFA